MNRGKTVTMHSALTVSTTKAYDTQKYKSCYNPQSAFFSNLVHEYCKKSTLHGLKYLQNKSLQYSER